MDNEKRKLLLVHNTSYDIFSKGIKVGCRHDEYNFLEKLMCNLKTTGN